VQPDTLLPTMKSDRRKIEKVLVTLLGNAYKFTHAGQVRVGVGVRNGRVAYTVSDTGIGIAPDVRDRVFEEFRQADGSATRKYGGTGLGLALSRRLARLLGGDLTFTSEPGQGTTFTVDLPLETDPEAARASMRPALVK
jgi:signal transduction histidine kinase